MTCRLCNTPDKGGPRPPADAPLCEKCAAHPVLRNAVVWVDEQWVRDQAAVGLL